MLWAHRATGLRATTHQIKISSSAPETTCATRLLKWVEIMSGYRTQVIPTHGAVKAHRTPRYWVLSIAVNNTNRLVLQYPLFHFKINMARVEHVQQGLLQQRMPCL